MPNLINVRVSDNTHMNFVSVKKSDTIKQIFENVNIDTTNGVFSINGVSISGKHLDKMLNEVLCSINDTCFDKLIYLTKVNKNSINIILTLEQIEELKYIIEDSGVNDAISYIDEIAEPQFDGYQCGRVIF